MERFKASQAREMINDKTNEIYSNVISKIKLIALTQRYTHIHFQIPSEVQKMLVEDGYKLSNINQHDHREGYLTLIEWK